MLNREIILAVKMIMKMIYTHQNTILVENAKNILAIHGIESKMKNEFAGGALGELSAIDTWAELWLIDIRDSLRAKALLAPLTDAEEKDDWVCENCGEENGASFSSCWQCESPKELKIN